MATKNMRWLGFVAIVVILMVGYTLRIQNLNVYPTGLSTDEAGDAIDGLQISQHGVYPLYEDIDRPEPLHQIIIAADVALFGPSIFVIRLLDIWIGVITIATACWAARQCVPDWSPNLRWLVGLTAAAILAISLGHITLSRAIYRGIIQPPCILLFVGFVLRGVQTGHRRNFILAGVWLGASMYTYTAAYSAPLAVVGLGIALLLFRRADWHRWLPSLTVLSIIFLLVSTLLIGRLLTIHQSVLGRAADVGQTSIADIPHRVDASISSFFDRGDPNPQYNTASAPLIPPLWGDVFIIGLVVLVMRVRQPSSAVLITLLIAEALPELATGEIPHGLRIVGEYAVYPIIIALAIGFIVKWIAYWIRRGQSDSNRRRGLTRTLQLGGVLVFIGVILADSVWAYQSYINYWPDSGISHIYGQSIPSAQWYFRTDRQVLSQWLAAQSTPLLVPADEINEATTRAWLMVKYPTVTTLRVTPDQTEISLPADTQLVVSWSLELGDLRRITRQYVLLDHGIITLLPPFTEVAHTALLTNIDSSPAIYDTDRMLLGRIKQLSSTPIVTIEPRVIGSNGLPVPIFDNNVALIGWHGPDTLAMTAQGSQSATLTYTLDWQPKNAVGHYYSSYLQLQTADSQRIAGDDVLIWRWLYPGALWQPGDIIPDTHSLSIPANLPPGAYRLVAGLYVFPDRRSPTIDEKGTPLGTNVTVGWVKVPAPASAINSNLAKVDAEFGNAFNLTAAGVSAEKDNQVTVTLQWQSSIRRPPIDATIFVHLVDANGKLIAQQDARPHNGNYPTFIWDANEIVTTTYTLTVPSGIDLNTFHLQVGMYTFPSLARLPLTQNGQSINNGVLDLNTSRLDLFPGSLQSLP